MKKKQPKHGGKRTGAGRKALPAELARVNLTTSIEQQTKANIASQASAERLSIGRLLDKVFNPKK